MSKYTFVPITNPDVCAECGSINSIELHHPIPISMGGKCVIPLCSQCHGKAHGMKRKNISELTKRGMEKKRQKGGWIGRPPIGTKIIDGKMAPSKEFDDVLEILKMLKNGHTLREVARIKKRALHTVFRIKKRWKTYNAALEWRLNFPEEKL